jgi:hypothetical protein
MIATGEKRPYTVSFDAFVAPVYTVIPVKTGIQPYFLDSPVSSTGQAQSHFPCPE